MTEKDSLRTAWQKTLSNNSAALQWGKAAEKLRSLPVYKKAKTVFATPAESLHQARINCLTDGKNLMMPSPSIREGFYLLPARTVPFKDLLIAVTYKGLEKYGKLLKNEALRKTTVNLLLCDSLAVDPEGGRLGNGKGFFDLCCALLSQHGCLEHDWAAYTFLQEGQLSQELLPREPWDINMTGAVTPARALFFNPPSQKPEIIWHALSQARIKKSDPLWKLFNKKHVGNRAQDEEL